MDPTELIVLGDTTVGGFARELNAQTLNEGVPWTIRDGGFDSWEREIFEPTSSTRTSTAAALGFLISPRLLEGKAGESIEPRVSAVLQTLESLSPQRTVLFGNAIHDPRVALPLTQTRQLARRAEAINDLLDRFSASHPWFHVLDHASLAMQSGVTALNDPRYEALGSLYFSAAGSRPIAALWCRALRALTRTPAKVLVVDLDNVMWGGTLGEDGASNLRMSASGEGLFYRRFQQALLSMRDSGVLLAICSKNNPAEAEAVLQDHPDCLLRPADFAAMEIGWHPKSEGIKRLAARLRLGVDSFVFVDDSSFEREEVRTALPDVQVLDFPESPAELAPMLARCTAFDRLRTTAEDALRARSYADEAQRNALRSSVKTPAEFYRSLQLKASLHKAQADDFDRLHQLLHKTNQFNLTAERLSPEQLQAKMDSPLFEIYSMRVSDRFGDSGLVGVAIVDKTQPERWQVENLLLSCRVIGRTVENAFTAWLAERARDCGARAVAFRFVATPRNQVARDFLDHSGLTPSADASQWILDVSRTDLLPPHYVAIAVT